MKYTVKQIARLAGISTRAIHYYDQIGLLKPSYVAGNRYRYYGDKELAKLQQILFFRELEFPLSRIRQIVQAPGYNPLEALKDQRKLLQLKKTHTEQLIATITKTITELKGGEHMSNDDKFSVFNDPTYRKHKREVEERWGNTDAYKQSMERVGKMSKAELEKVKEEGENIADSVADLLKKGFTADSKEVQEQIERFYNHMRRFYEPKPEMFRGLGQMYVDDPRFTEYYEKRAKGLAVFMRDAMAYFADRQNTTV